MAGTIGRTRCPSCTLTGVLYIDTSFVAGQIGEFGLAGGQMKTTATLRPVLKCRNCALHIPGEFDGDNHAVFPVLQEDS